MTLTTIIPQALTLDENYTLTVAPDAAAAVCQLVNSCQQITVCDATNRASVVAHVGACAKLRIDVERTRKELKERPLEIGRKIDAAAKLILTEPAAEENRLRRLAESYDLEQEGIRRAAQLEAARLAKIEKDRIADELEAEQRRQAAAAKAAADAAAARLAAERAAAAPISTIDDEIAAQAAADSAEDACRERARIEATNALAAQQARAVAALAQSEAKKVADVANSKVRANFYWDFEIVNIREFVQWCINQNRDWFSVLPFRSEILGHLKLSGEETPAPIAGLAITRKARSGR